MLGIETVSCHLLQQMTRMEMDWNMKKVGQLFQVSMPGLQKSPKKLLWLVFPCEISLNVTSFRTVNKISGSKWGTEQPASSFGLIFLLFPKKIVRGHAHCSWGKSPAPGH